MGSVAGEFWIRVAGGRVVVRLRTNAPAQKFLDRLQQLGLDGSLDALDGDPDMTRVRRGTLYVITFAKEAGLDEVRAIDRRF